MAPIAQSTEACYFVRLFSHLPCSTFLVRWNTTRGGLYLNCAEICVSYYYFVIVIYISLNIYLYLRSQT